MRKKGGLGKGLAALIPSEKQEAPAEETATVSRETAPVAETVPEPRAGDAAAATAEPTAPPSDVSRETADATDPDLVPVPGAVYRLVPLAEIDTNPKQPRQVFDEEGIEELKVSLSEVGLLQPIAVRETGDGYELIVGERRTRAARELGWETIPAIVRETRDEDLLRDALLENIHRVQLNPLEEGAAYQQLLDEFGVTQEELSKRIGRSRPQISNTIRLLSLPPAVQRRVAAGVLSAGHARAILTLPTDEKREALATRIVAEGMSVRATEEAVSMELAKLDPEEPADVSRETKPKRNGALRAPGIADLTDRLSDHFDTKVKVSLGQRKGRIVIEFGSVGDLERITSSMGLETKRAEPGV
ncbi:ParB/RepB/Spo0J family partition protein [Stackebrandtia nassauensis]|uniref:ParB-like partition protein n=1 Tax=Stackebrandtia nassauensis (strain DSM 44728 / CIP 108903 / NRRL B-16338 / NBRC 102104 / LLR-40K-21) TaxID=446470 RepID=D3Q5N5_STANL|nr:ParB/RepB/Spo0J family partition protein [Stackebrandtia nassauensis]ADD46095.1 parB-like partition protein [Stackebrandtia nassauensis DSM 44728]